MITKLAGFGSTHRGKAIIQRKRSTRVTSALVGASIMALGGGIAGAPALAAAPDPMVNAAPSKHTRKQLYKALDKYLEALNEGDYERVKWADRVRNTENNVALEVGDGLWGTVNGLGDYRLQFADERTGQVGFFGTVKEALEESAFALRLKVEPNGAVSEVETIVVRQIDSGIKFVNQKFEDKPPLLEQVAPESRSPRERLISIADGYFDTLQLNDGALFTKFHPDCARVENGVQTTNNEEFSNIVPVAAMGCEDQMKMGNYRYDDRLRARRFPLVDEERGLVLAMAFIDHSGQLEEYELTNGETVMSPLRRPHSFYLFELFKIEEGMIRQIEANFITVPYNMPSPWDKWD